MRQKLKKQFIKQNINNIIKDYFTKIYFKKVKDSGGIGFISQEVLLKTQCKRKISQQQVYIIRVNKFFCLI